MTGRPSAFIAVLLLVTGAAAVARQEPSLRTMSLTATGPAAWSANTRLDALIGEGGLQRTRVHEDTMVPGRVHERLAQRHEGLPVFGSGVVRQLENGSVHSVFG